ncbi:MAG TPA: hypothetical protein VNV85_17190 [Puia sp.]|jgi:hypothetical protein|nr:hypothetical protein [Puia sp.]
MELNIHDLQLLVNQNNKLVYKTIYDLIEKEYENALDGLVIDIDDELRSKTIGTCGIYLSSIVELLHTTKQLIENGFIESAGSTSAALWERSLTLRKIMLDPGNNSQIHVEHAKFKKTPWTIWNMVKEISDKEIQEKEKRKNACKLFYMQYSFLCSIKHGNPYTISYLNRPDKSSIEALFKVKPNDSFEDNDLKLYILLISMDIALDAILEYSKEYRKSNQVRALKEIRSLLNRVATYIPLDIAKIFITSPEEMGKEFWEFLEKLDAEESPRLFGPLL